MKLYLDMDGVLADFDAGYNKLFNKRQSTPIHGWYDIPDSEWATISETKDFWRDLPVCTGAYALMDFCAKYTPTLLTQLPDSIYAGKDYLIQRQKYDWALAHLLPDSFDSVVAVSHKVSKASYARPGDILVDDRFSHCGPWEYVGGIFVHHESVKDTIAQLKELGL